MSTTQQITTQNSVSSVALAASLLAVNIPMTSPPSTCSGDGLTAAGNITWYFGLASVDGKLSLHECIRLWTDGKWLRAPLNPSHPELAPYLPFAYCRTAYKNRLALKDCVEGATPLYLQPHHIGNSGLVKYAVNSIPMSDATLVQMRDSRPGALVPPVETKSTDLAAAALALGVPILGSRRDVDGATVWQLSPATVPAFAPGGCSARSIAARWHDWPWLNSPGNPDPLAAVAVASHNYHRLLQSIHDSARAMVVAKSGNRLALFPASGDQSVLDAVARHLANRRIAQTTPSLPGLE